MSVKKKVVAVALVLILMANLVFYALSKTSHLFFYSIVALIAVFTFWLFPKIE